MSDHLIELAERVEKASGPDRNLDAMIHARNGLEGVGNWSDSPAYTASLDAAMVLVDDEWESAVMWNRDEREAFAAVGPNALSGFQLGEGRSRGLNAIDTKARALTAACLRARAALNARAVLKDSEGCGE